MTKGNILTSFQTYSTQEYSKLLNLLNPEVLKDKILNQRLDTQLKDTLLYSKVLNSTRSTQILKNKVK